MVIGLGLTILLIFIFVTNIVIYVSSKPYIYNSATSAPSAEVALIPGAATRRWYTHAHLHRPSEHGNRFVQRR